jgi:hypothetical protein
MFAALLPIIIIFNFVTSFVVIIDRIRLEKHKVYLNAIIFLNFITLYPLFITIKHNKNGQVTSDIILHALSLTQFTIPLCGAMTGYYLYHVLIKYPSREN